MSGPRPIGLWPWWLKVSLVIAVLTLGLVWLSLVIDDGNDERLASDTSTTRPTPTTMAPSAPTLSDAEKAEGLRLAQKSDACAQFWKVIAQYTMTDEQSAAAFGDLAQRTTAP